MNEKNKNNAGEYDENSDDTTYTIQQELTLHGPKMRKAKELLLVLQHSLVQVC